PSIKPRTPSPAHALVLVAVRDDDADDRGVDNGRFDDEVDRLPLLELQVHPAPSAVEVVDGVAADLVVEAGEAAEVAGVERGRGVGVAERERLVGPGARGDEAEDVVGGVL